MDERKWKILSSEYLIKRPWLTARRDRVELPDGRVNDEYYVLEYPTWINVIAITEDGKIIMERQYRHAIGETRFEIPAGVVEPGEEPLAAAKRELMEETGYEGGEWSLLMTMAPNASSMNNLNYSYIAKGVRPTGTQHLDATEDLEVILMEKKDVIDLLQAGELRQALMIAPSTKPSTTAYCNQDYSFYRNNSMRFCRVIEETKDLDNQWFGKTFAKIIEGKYLTINITLANVVKDKTCWITIEIPTINNPFDFSNIEINNGICKPDYSYGISDPHLEPQRTGNAILNIWNERLYSTLDYFTEFRTVILIYNHILKRFVFFEEENDSYTIRNYEWEVNNKGHLIGRDTATGNHCFTWQPIGSRLSKVTKVPKSAIKFEL